MEQRHELIADEFHGGGVLLICVVALPQDIHDDELGITGVQGILHDALRLV